MRKPFRCNGCSICIDKLEINELLFFIYTHSTISNYQNFNCAKYNNIVQLDYKKALIYRSFIMILFRGVQLMHLKSIS